MRRAAFSLIALAALSGAAAAQENDRLDRTAAARQSIRVTSFYDLNPDCSHIGYATVKVVSNAMAGDVTIQRGRTYASYPPTSQRAACNNKSVPSVIVWYRSKSGFSGTDHFDIEIIWQNGDLWRRSVNVDVH